MSLAGLDRKVAIVTGAAGGIGTAVARRLSEEGAALVLADLDGAALDALASSLAGPAIAVAGDVASPDGVERIVAEARDAFGSVDLAHLNAGYRGTLAPVSDIEPRDFGEVMRVNATGVLLGLRAIAQQLIAQGRGGSIVVTSSGLGQRGGQRFGAYAASKHAVLGLMRSAALDLAEHGIRVNAVCPGYTATSMMQRTHADFGADPAAEVLAGTVPLGRYAAPSEQAAAVAWLLSEEASYVTGAALDVDGGVLAAAGGYSR